MNKQKQSQKGFTLAEMMIVITIIAIVSVVTIRIQKSRTYYETKFMTYSAYTNLKRAAGELLADGYELDPSTGIVKSLPKVADKAAADASDPMGLCQRITDVMNINGSASCSQPPVNDGTNFNLATANFVTTNGQRFYNFGKDPDPTADPDVFVYTVYVDINGKNSGRKDVYGVDVVKFTINTNGIVLADSPAATDRNYLTASVKISTGTGVTLVRQNVTFQEAACASRLASGAYCGSFSADASCPATDNPCEVYINKPGY